METEPYNLGGTKANTTEYKDWATQAIKERFSYLTTCTLATLESTEMEELALTHF